MISECISQRAQALGQPPCAAVAHARCSLNYSSVQRAATKSKYLRMCRALPAYNTYASNSRRGGVRRDATPAPVCVLLFALSYLSLLPRLCKCSCTRSQKCLLLKCSIVLSRLLCCVLRRAVPVFLHAPASRCFHFLVSDGVLIALVMHNYNEIIFQPYFAALARALYGCRWLLLLLLCLCANEIY